MTLANLYSSHIFMFPFRFDWNEEDKKSIYETFNEVDFSQYLGAKWSKIEFNPKQNNDHYNQLSYFTTYAQDILWEYPSKKNKRLTYSFERTIDDDNFIIKIKTSNNNEHTTYNLKLTKITLHLFFSGVAVLSIHVNNSTYNNFSDILNINDFGRRIYPQFIGENGVDDTKNTFLADKITLNSVEENFENLDRSKITIGKHITALLGNAFSQTKNKKNSFYLEPLLDDRMFVMSWYGNNELAQKISKNEKTTVKNTDWYKYIFVDTDYPTVQNKKMQQKLVRKATYFRWQKYNTLYGISKYSYVWLSENNDFVINHLVKHMHLLYHPMMLILLATKASITKYMDDIVDANLKDFQLQYEEYIMFYSKLNIQEITHQEQGYELYKLARKQMQVDYLTKKLDNKFTKFFEFSELKATQKQEEEKEKIQNMFNLVGGIFIFPSLMIALLSMSIYNYNQSFTSLMIGLAAIIGSGFLGYFAFKRLTYTGKDDEKSK